MRTTLSLCLTGLSVWLGATACGSLAFGQEDSRLQEVKVTPAMDEIPRGSAPRHVESAMSGKQKSRWYLKHSWNFSSLLLPALPAALLLANPPRTYPQDWRAGGPAFGRDFGDCLTTELAASTGHFLVGALAHEDPRYYPDQSKNVWHRTFYALAFTLVDRSDQGHPRLAISNFAGALSAGFVGRAYLPNGFDDLVHAGQRTGGTLGGYVPTLVVGYATGNLVSEYSLELRWLARKLHLPFIPK